MIKINGSTLVHDPNPDATTGATMYYAQGIRCFSPSVSRFVAMCVVHMRQANITMTRKKRTRKQRTDQPTHVPTHP